MPHGPDPHVVHPVPAHPRIVFLSQVIARSNVEIGDFTYYDDPEHALLFAERNILHHYEFLGDRLVIGRFCAIASGARFVMNGANHAMGGFSTFPFNIFGEGWDAGFDPASMPAASRGDTVVGSDVWIGQEAVILPGVRIGHGAVIGTKSVVGRDVAPYEVVVGNPARPVRRRFAPAVVDRLLTIAWWDWPVDRITRNLAAIRGADIEALEQAT